MDTACAHAAFPWRQISRPVFLITLIVVAAIRLYFCSQLPVNSGDVVRHLHYGLLVNERGLSAAALPLTDISDKYGYVVWANLPYNYPVVSLWFFSFVARLSPTIFSAKLALTLLAAICAVIIYRYSDDKWLALVYWASPMSIWWVSHEGQFEVMQDFVMLLALLALHRHRDRAALALLTVAVQVKLSAILLLPLFVHSIGRRIRYRDYAMSFLLGSLPTAWCLLLCPAAVKALGYSAPLLYNPYHWNLSWKRVFWWTPGWLVASNQLGTYTMLAILVMSALRSGLVLQYLAPSAFLVAIKFLRQAQPWYMLCFQPLLAPISNRGLRLRLFLLTPILDILSTVQILTGPYGYTGSFFGSVLPFTVLHTLK